MWKCQGVVYAEFGHTIEKGKGSNVDFGVLALDLKFEI